MLGGYQILDLRNIDLSRSTSEASITDVEVLKQLSQIADHIQKSYDFNKPLQNQLKPLLIRYRDKKVGEKHEVALYGNIEVINTYYKFRIIAKNEGEQLTINIEFEEKTDEYSNKYWDIKTATILLTSAKPIFEEITDKDGHKRFIEGNITTTPIEGVTYKFGKWSLSGSHLLIVLCASIVNETVIPFTQLGQFDLPQWIADRLVPLYADVISAKTETLYAQDGSGQTMAIYTTKTGNTIKLISGGSTLNADRNIRITNDFLIDIELQD